MEVPIQDLMQLSAERDALARQNIALREALEKIAWGRLMQEHASAVADAALQLDLPDAAKEVEAWRKKAERLDKWAEAWETYCLAPTHDEEKEREAFVDADLKLRRYARELAALRAAKAGEK